MAGTCSARPCWPGRWSISRRTEPAEQINDENLKGRRLHCGEAYVLRDGQEYFNLMPVWDWFWLPGITIAAKLPDIDRRGFVGGAGDGQSGLAAMDYGFGSVLNARKAWFFHGDRAVFLTGGLGAGGHPDGVYTSLDQCRLRGAVTLGIGGRSTVADRSGKFEGVNWLHHHGVAYVLFRPGSIDLKAGEAAGSWREINRGLSPEPVTDRVFRPLLYHGVKPEGLDCAYLLAPAAAPGDAQALAVAPGVEVLSNGRAVQAVRFADGTMMAAFFDAGEVKDGTGRLLAASSPCLVMVRGDSAWISNPAHKAKQVSVEARGRRRVDAKLPADGTAVKRDLPAPGL